MKKPHQDQSTKATRLRFRFRDVPSNHCRIGGPLATTHRTRDREEYLGDPEESAEYLEEELERDEDGGDDDHLEHVASLSKDDYHVEDDDDAFHVYRRHRRDARGRFTGSRGSRRTTDRPTTRTTLELQRGLKDINAKNAAFWKGRLDAEGNPLIK
jgi:hypothetical protein